MTEGAITAL